MNVNREQAVTEAFVTLATSLADGLDPVDLLSGLTEDSARLLDVASAGLLLADQRGVLHLLAASSEATRTVEIFQLQRQEGPCLDCYRTGSTITVADLRQATDRWPQFAAVAIDAGFASVHAVPLRLRANVLGAMGLFGTHAGVLNDDDLGLAQALAYVAAVALVQDKAAADKALINEQLQTALDHRVVLEQAKGVLAQHGNLDMDQAFTVLRGYAQDHNLRLTDVARSIVTRELPPRELLDHATSGTAGRIQPRPS